jgi:hypothetical protein
MDAPPNAADALMNISIVFIEVRFTPCLLACLHDPATNRRNFIEVSMKISTFVR